VSTFWGKDQVVIRRLDQSDDVVEVVNASTHPPAAYKYFVSGEKKSNVLIPW
jgi:hypothetical protein